MLAYQQQVSSSDLYFETICALRYNLLDIFENKVRQLPSPAVVDEHQENLLHKCARLCSAKGTRLLMMWLDSPPNINARNFRGETPLHVALETVHYAQKTPFAREAAEIVLVLLDAGAYLFLPDRRGNVPFGIVGQMPNCPGDIVRKVYYRVQAKRCSNVLGLMVHCGWHISTTFHLHNAELTRAMLKWRAYQLRPRRDGEKPNELLHLALEAGSPVSTLQMLLYLGDLDPNASFNGRTPLHVAVEMDAVSTRYLHIEFLLKYGANPNLLDSRGMKPIEYIKEPSRLKVYKLLVAAESVVPGNAVSLRSPESVHFAAADGLVSSLQFLLTPSNIHSEFRHGGTPLHYAARNRQANAVYYLLELGAEVDALDYRGWTPLFHAILGDEDEGDGDEVEGDSDEVEGDGDVLQVIGLLLHFGANVEHLGWNGQTALSLALETSNDPVVYQLVRHIVLKRYQPGQTDPDTTIEGDEDLLMLNKKCWQELNELYEKNMYYLPMLRCTRKELILVTRYAMNANCTEQKQGLIKFPFNKFSPVAFPIYGKFLVSRVHHANLELITNEEIGQHKDSYFQLDSLALSTEEFIRFFHQYYLL